MHVYFEAHDCDRTYDEAQGPGKGSGSACGHQQEHQHKKKQEDAKGKAMPVHHAMDWQGIGIMVNGLVQLQFLSTGQCHIGKGSTANSTSSQLLDSA